MIDIRPDLLDVVRGVLSKHVPGQEVRAFGSRVDGRPNKHSDLDLVVMSDEPLPPVILAHLRDAFSEADLPFKVDVVVWSMISEEFRSIIEERYDIVQQRG